MPYRASGWGGRLRRAVVITGAAAVLAPGLAAAHGFAGKRFFPSTLTFDDPFTNDELDLLYRRLDNVKDSAVPTDEQGLEVNYAKSITPAKFMAALGALNVARRKLGQFYTKHDIWLSPTTARVSEPWGNCNLSRAGASAETSVDIVLREPCQFTLPHNIMGTPAMSLPLAMHSTGVPIGVQVAGRPADEHLVLQLAKGLEDAMPWRDRVPPLHVSRVG